MAPSRNRRFRALLPLPTTQPPPKSFQLTDMPKSNSPAEGGDQSSLVSHAASMGRTSRSRELDGTGLNRDLEAQDQDQDQDQNRMKSIDLKDLAADSSTSEVVPASERKNKHIKDKTKGRKSSCCSIFCKVMLALLVLLSLAMVGAGIWFLWYKIHHAHSGSHRTPANTTSPALLTTAPPTSTPPLLGLETKVPNAETNTPPPVPSKDTWPPRARQAPDSASSSDHPMTQTQLEEEEEEEERLASFQAAQLAAAGKGKPQKIQTRDSEQVTIYGKQGRTLGMIMYDLEHTFNPMKLWDFAVDAPCWAWDWLDSHGWLKCPWGGKWFGDTAPDGGFADEQPGFWDEDKVKNVNGTGLARL